MQKYLGLQICIDLQKNCKICRRRDMTTIQKEKSDPEMLFFHSAQWRGVTVCFCVLLCVPVCYRVFLCVTTCYCLLPRVTLCYCVFLCVTVCYCLFLRATLCYCVVLLCVTLCYCVLLRSCVWKSETCEPEKFLLHSNSWSEKFSTEFWWTTTTTKKWKQRQNANFCDNGMSKNTSRNVSYWVRLGVAKMGLAKKRAKKSWRQLNLGRTEKRLDMIDPRDLQRWLAPI